MSYKVRAGYDHASNRYYVDESDIPGLNVEADTFEEFVGIVEDVAPDLLGQSAAGSKVDFLRRVVLAA